MKYALIDMGSNTIHLCVYEIFGREFKKLFKKKIVAGLAGYVENGILSEAGIQAAKAALKEFQEVLSSLNLPPAEIIATASLRNIENSEEALREITKGLNFPIRILSGEEEAQCGYYGIVHECHPRKGFVVDIGGGSTEISNFNEKGLIDSESFPLGSLTLYKRCIDGHILPTKKEQETMRSVIGKQFDSGALKKFRSEPLPIYAVGGTARAVLKLGNKYFGFDPDNRELKKTELQVLAEFLSDKGQDRIDLILKNSPERIHTIVPGALILRTLAGKLSADRIEICSAGVREGYLWERTHRN
ncbi:MAG: hypothetical protein PUC44_00025 [Eubacteriales bacterium]|nr:hypothetical protein [Eubacteriales bacterium]